MSDARAARRRAERAARAAAPAPSSFDGPDVPGLPVPAGSVRAWREWALRNPWPGNEPILDARHVLDTSAITEPGRPTRVLLSLDVGYHASGWWKNEEYERCLHVSVSHPRPDRPKLWTPKHELGDAGGVGMDLETPTDDEVRSWGDAIFGLANRWTWLEPAASVFDPYRRPNVVHLRLFLTLELEPTKPVGEPYGLTSAPWSEKVRGSIGGDVR